METNISIEEPAKVRDYFPSLFANKDQSIIILADDRTATKTFSGMIIHVSGTNNKKAVLGTYSTGWTYLQFTRLPKGSLVELGMEQS